MDAAVITYLQHTRIPLRLSTLTTSGWPIVLSLWYLLEDGALYCATPQKALVVTYLQREPRCGFEVAGDQPPYCGVRGQATATIDEERGLEILERLLIRYVGGTDNPLAQNLLNRPAKEVAVRLDLENITKWNFKQRMADSLDHVQAKICPE